MDVMNKMMRIMAVAALALVVLFFLAAQRSEEGSTTFWSNHLFGWKIGVLTGNVLHTPDHTPILRSGMIGFLLISETDYNAQLLLDNR
jgi:hypothetical protein